MERVAIVMGGTTPFGWAVVERLAEEGQSVALLEEDGEAAARAEADLDPANSLVLALDPTDPDEVSEALDAVVDRFGPPSHLVVSLAPPENVALLAAGYEALAATVERRVLAPLALAALVAERMEEGGAIVLVLPSAAANPDRALSGLVEGALTGFVRAAVAELARPGVRINAVLAGPDETSAPGPAARTLLARLPQGRFTAPADVAALVAMLLGDEGAHLSGQVIAVDGGLRASLAG